MTDLLAPQRQPRRSPSSRRPGRAGRRRTRAWGPLGSGIRAAAGAALVGLTAVELLVLLVWTSDAATGASGRAALRLGADLWLLGGFTRIAVAGGSVGIAPLGLSLALGALLVRAARRLADATPSLGIREVAARLGVGYAACSVVVALLARSSGAAPGLLSAAVGGLALGAGAGALGAWSSRARPVPRFAGRPAGAALRAGTGAVGLLLVVSGVLAAAALAVGSGAVLSTAHALHAGTLGNASLAIVQAGLVPNLAVWAFSVMTGPGFALGAGTTVSVTGVHLGAVPGVPVLAALPGAPLPAAMAALLAIPLLAGARAGREAVRRVRAAGDLTAWAARGGWRLAGRLAALGGMTGCAAGALGGLLALLSGGPAGPGRLAATGPSPWQVAGALGVEVGVAAALSAWHAGRHG